MKNNSILKKVGFASFIMMASVFASRIIGFARSMVIASIGGTSYGVDAYLLSFVLPEILNHVVASGFLSITFIPIFTKYLTGNDEVNGWKVFSIILNTFGLVLIIFILFCLVFTAELVNIIAPGINHPETLALTIKMTRIIIPAQFFFFTGGLFMAVQFSKEKFFIPALAPLIYNIGIILGGVLLSRWIGMEGFAWGVLAGSFFGNFLIQFYGARQVNLTYFFSFNFMHPDFKKYFFLTLPLIFGATMAFSSELIMKIGGSFLEKGSIAILNYDYRIMFLLAGFFGQAVGVAAYPFMARLIKEKKIDEFNTLLNQILKFLILVIPFSILFVVIRHETIFIVYNWGKFTFSDVIWGAEILPYFMIGAFAFTAQTIVNRGYYADENTLFPTVISTIIVVLSLPLYYFLIKTMNARGLALGISITAVFQTLVLYELWSKKTGNHNRKQVYVYLLRITVLSIGIGLILQIFTTHLYQFIDNSSRLGCVIIAFSTGTLFLILLLVCGFIFKIDEIIILFNNIYKKLKIRQ